MTADPRSGPALTSWGGITEPMTVLTNVVLAGLALVLAVRLGYPAAADGERAGVALAGAFVATALAATLGAAAHGTDPRIAAASRDFFWRAALYVTGGVGAATIGSVAFFAARGGLRTGLLVLAGVKLLAYVFTVSRRPEFRIAAMDYGSALAILLAGAAYAAARWQMPGATWLVAGVVVSLLGAVVQARKVAPHRAFNHNDVFHVVQMVALYMFYRGGVVLVDR